MAARKSKTSNKTLKQKGFKTGAIAAISVTLALIAGALCWWQLEHYEDNLLEIYAEQQDDYVQLALDQIRLVDDRSDKGIVDDILTSIGGSNAQYWTLSNNEAIVFVKDVTETNRYRGFTDETYYDTQSAQSFVEGIELGQAVSHSIIQIDERPFIASGVAFKYTGNSYKLCLLTSEHVVIDHNAYLAARTNLVIAIALVLALFVAGSVILGLRGSKWMKLAHERDAENSELRLQIEGLNKRLSKQSAYDVRFAAFDLEEANLFLEKLRQKNEWPVTFALLNTPDEQQQRRLLEAIKELFGHNVVRFTSSEELLLVFLECGATEAGTALAMLSSYRPDVVALCPIISKPSPSVTIGTLLETMRSARREP